MDAKALAKSKRAHTLHHRNTKPKKPSKNPSTETKQNSQKSNLPSNWDRYDQEEDELDVSIENPSEITTKKPNFDDVVLPKSKGADFKHLVDEAKANYHVDNFPSLDDFLAEDYKQGVGPLLSIRGEGILSWIGDDNFVVEEDKAASHEASFLSLNLHALAEQLAKVDVSERLFIEADLLHPESCGQGSNTSRSRESDPTQTTGSRARTSPEPDQKQTTQTKATASIFGEFASEDFSEKNGTVNQKTEIITIGSTTIGNSNPISFVQESEIKHGLNSNRYGKSSQSTALESPLLFYCSSASSKSKLSTFKEEAAEAELDMLLKSFSETELPDSSSCMSGTSTISDKMAPTSLPQITESAPGSMRNTPTAANLDDVLDDLLAETSQLSSDQNHFHQPSDAKAAHHEIQSSSLSHSISNSKALDDFDSWLDTI